MTYKKSRTGYGIVEALVASVIVGIVGIAIFQMLNLAGRSQKGVAGSIDFEILKTNLHLILLDPAQCSLAFQTVAGTPAKFNPAVPPAAADLPARIVQGTSTVAQLGADFSPGFSLNEITLTQVAGTPVIVSGATTTYLVQLVISAKRKAGGALGIPFESNLGNPFRFSLQTDTATSAITACGNLMMNFLGSESVAKPAGASSILFNVPRGATRASLHSEGNNPSNSSPGNEANDSLDIEVDLIGRRSTGYYSWTGGSGPEFATQAFWNSVAFGAPVGAPITLPAAGSFQATIPLPQLDAAPGTPTVLTVSHLLIMPSAAASGQYVQVWLARYFAN